MKSAGKARSNGLYRHIRTSKEIIRNLLNYYENSQEHICTSCRYTINADNQHDYAYHQISKCFLLIKIIHSTT